LLGTRVAEVRLVAATNCKRWEEAMGRSKMKLGLVVSAFAVAAAWCGRAGAQERRPVAHPATEQPATTAPGAWTPPVATPQMAASTNVRAQVQYIAPTPPNVTIEPPTREAEPTAAPAAPPARDKAQEEDAEKPKDLVDRRFLHGFRLGYAYVANYEQPMQSLGGQSLKDKVGMKTPHNFLIGYEGMVRMVGHSWLNVILVGNVMVAGLEQSKFFPTANGLLGFEIDNSFQVGVGTSVTPLSGQEAHAIVAAGWTPRVGSFYVPLHAFLIPDVDGAHRTGITTGVTW
jgi:hypothetical protein